MSENLSILEQAVKYVLAIAEEYPLPEKVVAILLKQEKSAKKQKESDNFNHLVGNWRLCFVTGAKKARNRGGIILGSGRYLPKFVKICLSYAPLNDSVAYNQSFSQGRVKNTVFLPGLQLCLKGPVKFLEKKSLLVFDFTRLELKLLGIKLYDGFIRGGEVTEKEFATESVSKQAFFAYFLIRDNLIAARGRGGGLALWGRINH